MTLENSTVLNQQVNWLNSFVLTLKSSPYSDRQTVEQLEGILRTMTIIENASWKGVPPDRIKQTCELHTEKLRTYKQHLEDTADLKKEIEELEAQLHSLLEGLNYS